MNAVSYSSYGGPDVLQIVNVETPKAHENEILIRIEASTVSSGDSRLRDARPWVIRLLYGLTKPKYPILGQDFAGTIVDANHSRHFSNGQRVIGITGDSMGGHAEFITRPDDSVMVEAPLQWSVEESATLPFGGITALYFLKQLPTIKQGKILIHGASGAIGTYAVQLAKHMGYHVTAVCSTKHVNLIYELGADQVIDYKKEDFRSIPVKFDAIFNTTGKTSYGECKPLMKSHASYIASDTPFIDYIKKLMGLTRKHHQLKLGVSENTIALLSELVTLANAGVIKAVIDKTYTLYEVIEAHKHVDTGHKTGAVILSLS